MSIPIDSIETADDVAHRERPSHHAAPSTGSTIYELTKPRMNFLVVITTMVGFYMASPGADRLAAG